VADRLRVNNLVLKVASWVASAMARRVDLWDDNLLIPPALAARAAVLVFGRRAYGPKPAQRSRLAVALARRSRLGGCPADDEGEAALRQELQRLADAVKRARAGQSSSSSGSRAQ
jgi:hypothetical protein